MWLCLLSKVLSKQNLIVQSGKVASSKGHTHRFACTGTGALATMQHSDSLRNGGMLQSFCVTIDPKVTVRYCPGQEELCTEARQQSQKVKLHLWRLLRPSKKLTERSMWTRPSIHASWPCVHFWWQATAERSVPSRWYSKHRKLRAPWNIPIQWMGTVEIVINHFPKARSLLGNCLFDSVEDEYCRACSPLFIWRTRSAT